MTKIKSWGKTLLYPLVKWVLFMPTLLLLVVYVIAFGYELLFNIKPLQEGDKELINDVRLWFIYLALPFHSLAFVRAKYRSYTANDFHRITVMYNKRFYCPRLKMYLPFIPPKMGLIGTIEDKFNISFNQL